MASIHIRLCLPRVLFTYTLTHSHTHNHTQQQQLVLEGRGEDVSFIWLGGAEVLEMR